MELVNIRQLSVIMTEYNGVKLSAVKSQCKLNGKTTRSLRISVKLDHSGHCSMTPQNSTS